MHIEYLRPIWRCEPNGNGVGAIALDPREAKFVSERGFALLDGQPWRVSLEGWAGGPEQDGRVGVRIIRCA